MSTVAIIPARGGSKGVPRKNIRMIAGRPLITYMIGTAMASRYIDHLYVSTDDYEIADISKEAGAGVIMRPASISGDTASSESVMLHALEELKKKGINPEFLVMLQCTSPLTTTKEIDDAIKKVIEDPEAGSSFVATPFYHFLWDKNSEKGTRGINHDGGLRKRRQDLAPQFLESGSAYVMRADVFAKEKNRFCGKVLVSESFEPNSALEIDEPIDLVKAEAAIRFLESAKPISLIPEKIEAIIFDFDGVMTDDKVLVDEHGIESVTCSRSDGYGLGMLKKLGIPLLILSTEENPVVMARARKLGIEVIQGSKDKANALKDWMKSKSILGNIVYMGNDLNDIECMKMAAVAVAPANASDEVKSAATIICRNKGGEGAVRELADLLLKKFKEPIDVQEKYLPGLRGVRPWGRWKVIKAEDNFCIKEIFVNPRGKLSLQSHRYRSETWEIISGTGIVQIDEKRVSCKKGDLIKISKGQKHRIENSGEVPLVFIEIQTGEILSENDIVRFEDKYGR